MADLSRRLLLAGALGTSAWRAEGIETGQQLDMIQSLGVGYGQGTLFGRPRPHLEGQLTAGAQK